MPAPVLAPKYTGGSAAACPLMFHISLARRGARLPQAGSWQASYDPCTSPSSPFPRRGARRIEACAQAGEAYMRQNGAESQARSALLGVASQRSPKCVWATWPRPEATCCRAWWLQAIKLRCKARVARCLIPSAVLRSTQPYPFVGPLPPSSRAVRQCSRLTCTQCAPGLTTAPVSPHPGLTATWSHRSQAGALCLAAASLAQPSAQGRTQHQLARSLLWTGSRQNGAAQCTWPGSGQTSAPGLAAARPAPSAWKRPVWVQPGAPG
eukprot:364330-Chlamydomonas_euryale.AAC.2